ncbi:multidrug efflux system membrane fusion protein [Oceanisphaera litoralis]|uniref:efflux RND transporter periplasmic adaptor subunit n=1 Tax=Oceanisphaera litoralis TaxID=225144 RepID=UPI00195BC091|nr:efflux RND transporter periplasmic adaptor subunit [Oceanisphaera litoralis]MBM7455668.1 multidrug efflux system membrane fusion protein [Oceanisphaera litoralis]
MAVEAFTRWLARHKGLGWLLLVVAVVLFWLWRGERYQAQVEAPAAEPVSTAEEFHVEVMAFDAEPYQPGVVLQGQLLPHRTLVMRTRASGTLTRLPRLGQTVTEGDPLLTLSDDGRTVKLARAEAEYRLRQAEVTAATRLRRNQMISETDYLALKSAAAMAEAGLAEARLALSHTRIEAPFTGSIDALPVELGQFVQTGDVLLTLVDVSTLKLSAAAPQQQVAELAPGLPVTAVLLDGRELTGELEFVAQSADVNTRSFMLEARLDNPRGWRVAGASAELNIALSLRPAYRLSPALLALDANGRPGVHIVDEQDRMQWVPVTLLGITPDEAWIGGLPASVRLITRGAGFVTEGEGVRVRDAEPVP